MEVIKFEELIEISTLEKPKLKLQSTTKINQI